MKKAILWLLLALPWAAQAGPSDAWREHGLKLLKAGRAPEAGQALSRALRLDPRDARAWAALGNAQWAQGQKEGALQSWRNSLKLQPQNPGLAAFVQKLEPAPVAASAPSPSAAPSRQTEERGPWLQRGLASLFTGLGVAMVVLL